MNTKMYHSISEACGMTGLEPNVLRYWEDEFPQLRPKRNSAGKRTYREKDIELILRIKYLLYEEKYTISGARQKIKEERREERLAPAESGRERKTRRTELVSPRESHDDRPTSTLPAMPSDDLLSSIREELEGVLVLLKK